jgi:hypothetical protein
MITKAFELRDRGTFIPVIAIKMVPSAHTPDQPVAEAFLLRRAGFGFDDPCIVLCRMECSGVDRNATYDAFSWGVNPRTFHVAHLHLMENFDALESGAVIDVEFILGETEQPKISERLT